MAQPRSLWAGPASVTALILLIPILGNHFVDGWNWPFRGFVLFGAVIFSTALAFQLATRNADSMGHRVAFGITLVTSFVLFWGNFVQAADDVNPAALTYLIVPVVGIAGAVIVRFRPDGMARVLFTMALTQAFLLTRAFIIRNPDVTPWTAPVIRGFAGNAVNLIALLVAALLFRTAARRSDGTR
jgi:hypothetical protein